MRYLCRAIARLCLTLALPVPVLASSACEPPREADPLAWMIAHEPECNRAVPDFNFHLGRLLNEAARFQEAADRLEFALLQNPDSWVVRLEYAIALEGSGDALAAASLLSQLARDAEVPAVERREISTILVRRGATRGPLNLFTFAVAYDDNLQGDISQDGFELTLPDGRLPVELSAEQRPQGGVVALGEYRREDDVDLPAGSWRYAASVAFRGTSDLARAGLARLGLQVERRPEAGDGIYAQAGLHLLARGNESQLRQGQFTLGYEHVWLDASGACYLRGGLRAQDLSYPSASELDGRLIGPLAQVSCRNLFAELRGWHDQPVESGRPGGAQNGIGIRLVSQWELGEGVLAAEYEHVRRRDRKGYSPLLENNARRTLQLDAVRLEYRWPDNVLGHEIYPFVALDGLRQRSNLPLFGLDNRVFAAGVRVAW